MADEIERLRLKIQHQAAAAEAARLDSIRRDIARVEAIRAAETAREAAPVWTHACPHANHPAHPPRPAYGRCEACFLDDLERVLKQHGKEAHPATPELTTPAYMLAEYLKVCLEAFHNTILERRQWHTNEK